MNQSLEFQKLHCDSKGRNGIFAQKIYTLINTVPKGRVVSYSQLSLMAGHPNSARTVGQIAHFGPTELPWHRLVYSSGNLARGYVPGGAEEQKRRLESEGVMVDRRKVDMYRYGL